MPPRSSQDQTFRFQGLPFIGQVAGYNRADGSDLNVSVAQSLGDLSSLAGNVYGTTTLKDNMVRVLVPSAGNILAAYLSLTLAFSSLETSPQLSISISTTTSTADLTPVVTSAATISAQMALIQQGISTPFQASNNVVALDRINILPLIPAPGSANFRQDLVVVGIHFTQAPAQGNGYALTHFALDMNMQVIR